MNAAGPPGEPTKWSKQEAGLKDRLDNFDGENSKTMKPPPFRYLRARSVDDAVAALAREPEARPLAGGQSLIAMMNVRLAKPAMLIDINGLKELDYIALKDGQLAIGALTRHASVRSSALVAEHCPLLAEAYQWIAHKAIRNRGTYGGNLCHADPASENPMVALIVGASLVLKGPKGERTVKAEDFFKGVYQTAARADELLTEVRLPIKPKRQGWGFFEVSPRKGDFAMVALGCTLDLAGGKIKAVSLGCAGVGAHAVRLKAAEAALSGQAPGADAFAKAAAAARDEVRPTSDFHADEAMRRDLVFTLTRRALKAAQARCQ
jgi:carbon-monoxide dehydrogenase medium subunit